MCDIHEEDMFGIIKMVVLNDIKTNAVVTLNQINARFVDEANMGEYEYLMARIMISKIEGEGEAE